mmetsp:Transcript_48356/g.92513  ORF Transcript_48356/g.92513 Transcript_48356/m.92513 type:complete len:280 (-) Transcript_48356:1463-2302(-)
MSPWPNPPSEGGFRICNRGLESTGFPADIPTVTWRLTIPWSFATITSLKRLFNTSGLRVMLLWTVDGRNIVANWRVMGGSHCSFFFPTSHIGLSRATARWLWRSCWTDLAILFVSMSISPDLSPEMSILRAAALVDCDLNSPISWSLRCAAHICCADPIVGSCLSWCTLLGPGRSSPHASLADMERIVRTRFRATADDRVIDEGTRVSRGGLGENAFEAVNGINWAWLCGGCICLRLLRCCRNVAGWSWLRAPPMEVCALPITSRRGLWPGTARMWAPR